MRYALPIWGAHGHREDRAPSSPAAPRGSARRPSHAGRGGRRAAILDRPGSPGDGTRGRARLPGCAFVPADVTDEAAVSAAVTATRERFGGVHVAVNCAGVGVAARVLSKEGPMSLGLFTKVIQVNLIGTYNVLRLAAAEMVQNTPNRRGRAGRRDQHRVRRPASTGRSGRPPTRRQGGGGRHDAARRARLASLGSPRHDHRAGTFDTPDARAAARRGPPGAGGPDPRSRAVSAARRSSRSSRARSSRIRT
jgi:hypothetical protein